MKKLCLIFLQIASVLLGTTTVAFADLVEYNVGLAQNVSIMEIVFVGVPVLVVLLLAVLGVVLINQKRKK